MACHSALQFVQHNGKFYRDIVGAYPRATRGLPGGAPGGTTKFKDLVSGHVTVAKAREAIQ